MDERAFFTESNTTKPAQLNCPFCRSQETYELRWLVRKKKDRIPNGAGSQNRNLRLGLTTQYWSGTSFITNVDDSCTTLASTAFSFGNFRKTLTNADAVIVTTPVNFASGLATLTLQKPGGTRTGTFDLSVSLGTLADTSCLQAWAPTIAASAIANRPFLQGGWCTSGFGGVYGKDPSARISFGIYRGADNMIYQRENF